MGSSQSVEALEQDEEEEDDDDEDEEHETGNTNTIKRRLLSSSDNNLVKKVLQQEPEMLPCYSSASPLSPQLSSLGTPRLGPSIKVWDPYNVLAPSVFSSNLIDNDDRMVTTEVYLISHGECELDLRPDLVSGRCPEVALTGNGERQARALAVFLKAQGVGFNAVYSSPLDRARATAASVCQETNFAEERIQSRDELTEMSYGHWEGYLRSEMNTPEMLSLIAKFQPDFSAPSGESLRQVEFRMMQFLNATVLGLPEKLRSDFSSAHQIDNNQELSSNQHSHDRNGHSSLPSPHWDLLHRQRQGFTRKKSGKSRLQFVTKTEDHHETDQDDFSNQISSSNITSYVGIFSHSLPIKCLLTGLLHCSPVMSNKICIDEPSLSVLQHSWKTGWQIKRLNDTAHLRLL